MPHLLDCRITAHSKVAEGHFRMALESPPIAAEALPGQFCMVQVQEGLHPFLRRPMSIERILQDNITILYKAEGEGTRILAALRPGQSINLQGPLGRPFPIDTDANRHILVAGGIGVAPLPGLAKALAEAVGRAPQVVLAARSRSLLLCAEDFEALGCPVHVATDDGSAGLEGFASDVLRGLEPEPDTVVYTCGPMPMMKACHAVCHDAGATCFASLETEMACGDGVCLGCVVEANVEIEAERMLRVCCDGPVFDTALIKWEAYG